MKRLIVFTMMMAFIFGVSGVLFAGDGDIENASQWCTANDDLGYSNHGTCVKFIMSSKGPGDIGSVIACKELLDYSPQIFYDKYNNLTECVSHLQDGYVVE